MAMAPRSARRRYLVKIDVFPFCRDDHCRMNQPLEPPLSCPLPWFILFQHHVRRVAAEIGFVMHQLHVSIVSCLGRSPPRPRRPARLKTCFAVWLRPEYDLNVFGNPQHAFFDPIADQFSLGIVDGFCSLRKRWFFIQLVLLAPDQTQDMVNAAILWNENGATDLFVTAVLVNRVWRHGENVIGFKVVSFTIIPLPAFAGKTKQRRRTDMAVRPAYWRMRRDACK